jgi:hypothetical protein
MPDCGTNFRLADNSGLYDGTAAKGAEAKVIDDYAVKLATEYLDHSLGKEKPATLVDMLGYVDAHDKVVLTLEEVNEALKQRPSAHLQRVDGRVIFNQSSGDREITEDDLKQNVQMYHDAFWALYRQLQDRKDSK